MWEDDITFCDSLIEINLEGWQGDPITHTIDCPIKSKCHRFINQPKNHPWLSLFVTAPYSFKTESCDHYWEISRKEKTKLRKKK